MTVRRATNGENIWTAERHPPDLHVTKEGHTADSMYRTLTRLHPYRRREVGEVRSHRGW